ncbi:MAG TPA: glycosyltransferase [Nevskiaceae bacterium]|nr:glycosyltransferase [Nevskiaceae bacterium]
MPDSGGTLKVAIVHDWLIGGGAERVVQALHELYPDAPIYTSYCTPEWRKRLDNKVLTGFLQRWPFSKLRKFLPLLRIWWFTHLDFSGYDVVISSSGNGEAMGVRVPKDTVHINYCHTPTHYYWRHYDVYMKRPGFGIFDPLARLGLKLMIGPLRRWDLKASKRPDYFIANSTHIQADIKKYYGRDSVVIHPPVDIDRFNVPEPKQRHGFVTASRQVPHKHIDVIVAACTQLGVPLKVIGRGPEHDRLVRLAGPSVTFLTNVSDAEMGAHVAGAEAFLFASFDDFGVVPVEALAAGTPVIAYRAGGAFDYIQEGKTGLFFDKQTPNSLAKILRSFPGHNFDHQAIREYASQYSPQHFKQAVQILMSEL